MMQEAKVYPYGEVMTLMQDHVERHVLGLFISEHLAVTNSRNFLSQYVVTHRSNGKIMAGDGFPNGFLLSSLVEAIAFAVELDRRLDWTVSLITQDMVHRALAAEWVKSQ